MKMNRLKILISATALACLLGSCQKELVPEGGILKGGIIPRVSTKSIETKSSDCSAHGTWIASYTMESASDKPIYISVFEYDNDELPSGMSAIETKSSVTTTSSINTVGQQFLIDAWLESANRYDGSQDGDGHEYIAADKTDWHFIKNAVVERGSSKWDFAGGAEYPWRNRVKTNFWSVYPTSVAGRAITYPGNTAADAEQATLSMTYTLPTPCSASPYTDAQNQKDLCFAYNTKTWQDGSDNKVDIEFFHALSAVYFKIGDVAGATIERIGFNNVSSSASCDITGGSGNTPTFEWKGHSTPLNVRQDFVSSDFDATSKEQSFTGSDKVFMLIPQTLGASTQMAVTFKKGDGTTETKTANISKLKDSTPVEWKPGKKYMYKISYDPNSYDFELVSASQETQSFSNTTSNSAEVVIPITSDRTSASGTTDLNWNWKIKSYKVGSGDPVEVNSTSFTNGGGLNVAKDGSCLKVTALARTASQQGSHAYWTNAGGISGDTDGSGWSPLDWSTSRAKASAPLDLSKFDFRSESGIEMTTANCYVIRHAGTYKIPLVYGNGIKNGCVNEQSYYPNVTGGTCRLERFVNHKGNGIISPFIEYNTSDGQPKSSSNKYLSPSSGTSGYSVIWQDKADIITINGLSRESVSVVDTDGEYRGYTISYLTFTIPQSKICQNNALIAVMDSDGVMWSWCIWTTNDPELLSNPIEVTNYAGNTYNFFPLSAIGYIDGDRYPSRERVVITLEQADSGNTIDITVDQPEVRGQTMANFYQFGRKDPMCNTATPASGSHSNVNGMVDLMTSVKNPGTFYGFYDESRWGGDWCSTTYNNLWTGKISIDEDPGLIEDSEDIIKTVYDPSPIGYKIPAPKAFTGFTTDGTNSDDGSYPEINANGDYVNGWNFFTSLGPGNTVNIGGPTIYFPGLGSRDEDGIWPDPAFGIFWSAVPKNDVSAWDLGIGIHPSFGPLVHTQYNNSRSEGYSIRPVLE